jgi:tRNA nucleotidyltransferase/poly(A) polymerase
MRPYPELFHKYEVGGAVRDQLLGRRAKDVDFTCVLDDVGVRFIEAEECFTLLGKELVREGYKIFVTTPQFYTYRARNPEGKFHDFVLARREGPYSDGRRPDWVQPGTLEDDLARRDFTINAMAREAEDYLIDPFGGLTDLDAKLIRCVGDPVDRFTEDPLRVLRALRFAVALGFDIEDGTMAAIHGMDPELIASVAKERRRDELEKMFQADLLQTLDWLSHYLHPDTRDAVLAGVKLRPCFTFKGQP